MESQLAIVELLIAISRLPEDRRRVGEVWYESQKEHWVGWLFHYNSPGAYSRRITSGRDARFVYNHVACPGLLTYLAHASGVRSSLVRKARQIEAGEGTENRKAGAIRRVIPWELVQAALKENGYVGSVV